MIMICKNCKEYSKYKKIKVNEKGNKTCEADGQEYHEYSPCYNIFDFKLITENATKV